MPVIHTSNIIELKENHFGRKKDIHSQVMNGVTFCIWKKKNFKETRLQN